MKKITLYSLLVLGWLLLLTACQQEGSYAGPQLLVSWTGGQFGYINQEGETVIPAQFAFAMPFSEGMGAVNVGGKGSDGYMPVDGKWGFVNEKGKLVINPKYFSPSVIGAPFNRQELGDVSHEGYVFSEGLAAVKDIGRYWKYINKKDSVVIDGNELKILSARKFHQGLANVLIGSRWGYINKRGELAIQAAFKYPADFQDGMAFVVNAQNRRIMIDRSGQQLYSKYTFLTRFHDGYAAVRPFWDGQSVDTLLKRKVVLINKNGAIFTPPDFDWIGRFGSGLAPALVGSKLAHPIIYPQMLKYTDEPGGKWGFIDYKGKFEIIPKYQEAKGFVEGFAPVKNGGLWGYLRKNKSMLTGYEFRWAGFFNKGLAPVRLGPVHADYDGLYAYINTSGEIIWIEQDRRN